MAYSDQSNVLFWWSLKNFDKIAKNTVLDNITAVILLHFIGLDTPK
ncbi:Uncharacterised protein [Porphyromonas cangingivalis]|nr:Uncharacterised protein [Porphyromonas cangingivalis]